MRIGVFGGSFNPIHIGHCMIASMAASTETIDEVWVMVSPQNPLKSESGLIPEQERLRLARLALEDCRDVKVSDFEFHLPKPTYTYSTLRALKKEYPQHDFRLLIGSDNWLLFNKWRDSEKIISEFGIVIYIRPDYPIEGKLPENVEVLEGMPQLFLSSTMIRSRLEQGLPIDYLVPEKIKSELWKRMNSPLV